MKDYAREWVTGAIFVIFMFLAYKNPTDPTIGETAKNAFLLAVGYWIGGSKVGADTATKNAETVSQAARATNEVQPVTVVNDESAPVPVKGEHDA